VHVFGLTAWTRFETFDFKEDVSQFEERKDGIWVYTPIFPTEKRYPVVPILFDYQVYKEPYHCFVTVWGHFDTLISAECQVIVGNNDPISITIDIKEMNKKRARSNDGRYIFPAGKYLLPIEWNKTENLKIITTFIAKQDGQEDRFQVQNVFVKKHIKEYGNRIWFAMMSV
jgi:hypothetical protein